MKSLLRLYPPDWRRRYGPEFSAMLESESWSPRMAIDLIRGALDAWLHPELYDKEDELRLRYPQVPVGYPAGASDEESSYEHYLVCFLEFDGLRRLIGEEKARHVMDFWRRDHYTEIYAAVMRDLDEIARIVERHQLRVPGASDG